MNWKKIIFLTTFSIFILFASFFMITESARYYRLFYDQGSWQPLYLATLLELFVLVLAAHGNIFQNQFVMDDFAFIVDWPLFEPEKEDGDVGRGANAGRG